MQLQKSLLSGGHIRGFKNCFSCPRRFQYIALNKTGKIHSIYLRQFMGPGIVQVAHSYALPGHLMLFVTAFIAVISQKYLLWKTFVFIL